MFLISPQPCPSCNAPYSLCAASCVHLDLMNNQSELITYLNKIIYDEYYSSAVLASPNVILYGTDLLLRARLNMTGDFGSEVGLKGKAILCHNRRRPFLSPPQDDGLSH